MAKEKEKDEKKSVTMFMCIGRKQEVFGMCANNSKAKELFKQEALASRPHTSMDFKFI